MDPNRPTNTPGSGTMPAIDSATGTVGSTTPVPGPAQPVQPASSSAPAPAAPPAAPVGDVTSGAQVGGSVPEPEMPGGDTAS
ncbi:hypothetical protein A2961_02400 [Candidatus Woesebacteria bacterium RIFCSPLOWO2_01_FULL_39_21]|uniref:Uncharacterized protein n=1 Tax=Candidatus Woesebacteria bacterium RIFCSPLOWO2_01_FULL_39_21 TaxID=1802519 RepID=A0A1F8BFM7_9BACT|nr:MAG: hypothetical protein A2691_04440 [Candidatus Woesebacteria bacterium RIFCSPHIGHO2_01_FULL_39_23]OGM62459.1 MAG: hypothetical protein A2961_02400 [Candidatus Woesebacteria bacterium RIFCSPLOWO2_01_FULL_39_21]